MILIAFPCLGIASTHGDWERVVSQIDGGGAAFIRPKTIVVTNRASNTRKVWTKTIYKSTQEIPLSATKNGATTQYTTAMSLEYYDCPNRTIAESEIIFYSITDQVVATWKRHADLIFSDVPPESVGEVLLNYVCTQTTPS